MDTHQFTMQVQKFTVNQFVMNYQKRMRLLFLQEKKILMNKILK